MGNENRMLTNITNAYVAEQNERIADAVVPQVTISRQVGDYQFARDECWNTPTQPTLTVRVYRTLTRPFRSAFATVDKNIGKIARGRYCRCGDDWDDW